MGIQPHSTVVEEEEEVVDDSQEDTVFLQIQQRVANLKLAISEQSRRNFELERDVRFFDVRIGLLISHRITFEDIVYRFNSSSYGKDAGVRNNRMSDPLLQHYGNLFYLLQTEPMYMARLLRLVCVGKIEVLLELVMFTLYGHHYDPREEHLLLCTFEHALNLEFEQAADVTCVLRSNSAITRMMTSYTRRGSGQEYLQRVLSPQISFLVELEDSLEIHPVEVYRQLAANGVIKDDTTTYEECEAAALENNVVQRHIEIRVSRLEEIVDSLLDTIVQSVETVPYGIRWLCRTIRTLTQRYFPNASLETVTSLIGGFFFLRYINPNIVSPHTSRLSPRMPTPVARRTLTLVAKVLQSLANHASHRKLKEAFMRRLDSYVMRNRQRIQDFLNDLCEVQEFHDLMQMEHFLAFSKNEQVIDIAVNDIIFIHELIDKHSEKLGNVGADRIRAVLKELGTPMAELPRVDNYRVQLKLFSPWSVCQEQFSLPLEFSAQLGHQLVEVDLLLARCKVLLVKLFKMLPGTMHQSSLDDVLLIARQCEISHIAEHAMVTAQMLDTLEEQGVIGDAERHAVLNEVKKLIPQQKVLFQKYRNELRSLLNIHRVVQDHHQFLQEQLETYKEYLQAVRKKAATVEGRSALHMRTRGPFEVSLTALLRDRVVVEGRQIPESRLRGYYIEFSSPSPGVYDMALYCRGRSRDMITKRMQLEDLLELQQAPQPRFSLGEFVTLDARRALSLVSKFFM